MKIVKERKTESKKKMIMKIIAVDESYLVIGPGSKLTKVYLFYRW